MSDKSDGDNHEERKEIMNNNFVDEMGSNTDDEQEKVQNFATDPSKYCL